MIRNKEFGFEQLFFCLGDEPDGSGYEARAGFLGVGLITLPLLKLQINKPYSATAHSFSVDARGQGPQTGLGDVGGGIASDSGELLRICMLAAA